MAENTDNILDPEILSILQKMFDAHKDRPAMLNPKSIEKATRIANILKRQYPGGKVTFEILDEIKTIGAVTFEGSLAVFINTDEFIEILDLCDTFDICPLITKNIFRMTFGIWDLGIYLDEVAS